VHLINVNMTYVLLCICVFVPHVSKTVVQSTGLCVCASAGWGNWTAGDEWVLWAGAASQATDPCWSMPSYHGLVLCAGLHGWEK